MKAALSVVMPMRDCAHCVLDLLNSLYVQVERHDLALELVIVDDASGDGCGDMARTWAAEHSMPLTLLRNQSRLWSYGSRIRGMRAATAPFVWNIDADDIIPARADLSIPLKLAEKEQCDILHCRAVGVSPPSKLQLPLAWTEPLAESLEGREIFAAFIAQSYPPGILWNKFFSQRLARVVADMAPAVEVSYFDVKFFGLLAPLFAESYLSCNEVIYEYRMRTHRPAGMYARQVAALLNLRERLAPIVKRWAPGQLKAFLDYCGRRLAIQIGHLAIMAEKELEEVADDIAALAWLNKNILPSLGLPGLFTALLEGIRANALRLDDWRNLLGQFFLGSFYAQASSLSDIKSEAASLAEKLSRLPESERDFGLGHFALKLGTYIARDPAHMAEFSRFALAGNGAEIMAITLLLANARLAAAITRVMAPQTDITKKAN